MNVLRAGIGYVLGRLKAFLSSADDPRKVFSSPYQRQHDLLVKVQKTLDDTIATKQNLEAKAADMMSKLPKLQNQARNALIDGEEDRARFILLRHHITTSELQIVNEQIRELQQEERRLSLVEQRLVTQIERFITRQKVMTTRYSSTETQERVSEVLSDISQELTDLGIVLQEAEEKARHMRARASAMDRLVEPEILSASLITSDIAGQKLSESDVVHNIEDQISALKQEINKSDIPPK